MSGLCGHLGPRSNRDQTRDALERMTRALTRFDGSRSTTQIGDHGALAAAGTATTAREGGYLAAVHGRPSFADAALAEECAREGAAAALVRAYREQGPDLLTSLKGPFAIAIVHDEAREALIAVDRIGGRHPLAYKLVGDRLLFGSFSGVIRAHPSGGCDVDPQALYNYVYFHVVPGPATAFRGIRQLAPGSYVRFADGAVQVKRYWEMLYREDRSASTNRLSRELHGILRDSVRRDAGDSRVACFLSGGTDSSTVAGVLNEVSDSPALTYSMGFEAGGYDEMEYARVAARHFGTDHREYYVQPSDVIDLITPIAQAYSDPFGNESAVPTHCCARKAREDGVQRLLAGDGGDELFAGNERYAVQQIYALYERVPELLRRSLLEPLVFSIPGGEGITLLRRTRNYIKQAKLPMPERMQVYNFIDRMGAASIFEQDFLAGVEPDQPPALLSEAYRSVKADSMLNRMLGLDLPFTLAYNDLPKVSRMCEMAGVDVAYPLLSDEIVEFSARVPARLKLKRLRLRWFWKHALKDYLPAQVLKKKKHGFGLPFGVWMRDHAPLEEVALDSLRDLKARHVIRPDFVERLIVLQRDDHARYYGSLIWVLMMLEQWFKAHVD